MNFYETVMGKRFFEGTMPSLIRAIEKQNQLISKQNETIDELAKQIAKLSGQLKNRNGFNFIPKESERIHFDLSDYPDVLPETAKWIDRFFSEGFSQTSNKTGAEYILHGFMLNGDDEEVFHRLNLTYGAFSEALDYWAYNDKEMLLFMYSDGEITLRVFSSRKRYEREKAETLRWYKEER